MQKCDFVIHAAALVSFVSSDVDRLKKIKVVIKEKKYLNISY